MSRARQTVLLIVLAAVLSIAVAQWAGLLGWRRDEPVTAPAAAARPARPGHPGVGPGDRIASLNVAALEASRSGGLGGRDPWRFVDPPPIPRTDTSSKRVRTEAPAPVLAPAEPPLPRPEEFTLRYLGRFGPPERKIAVFTDGRRVLDRQEGEVLDGKFIVSRIGYEWVEIRFVGFPEASARRVGVAWR